MAPLGWKRWAPVALPAALVLLAFAASLFGGFVWDDRPLIVENHLVKSLSGATELATSSFWETGDRHDRFRSFFRPTVGLSYALDHALWGLRPLGFRLTNLILHLLCTLLVVLLARQSGLGDAGVLAAGSLFAIHPVHVESVAWISGRTDLLCAMLMLASFLAWRQAGRVARNRWSLAAALALFALALLSKEMAATLPLVVLADRWLNPIKAGRSRSRTAAAMGAALPFVSVLLAYMFLRGVVLAEGGIPLYSPDAASFVATAFFAVARYLTLLILPVGLDAHYPYALRQTFLDPVVIMSAAMLAVATWGVSRMRHARGDGFLWALWIPLTLLPVMTFGRFGDVIVADRFLYIPSAGLCVLAGLGFEELCRRWPTPARQRLLATAGLGLALTLAGASAVRAQVWRDDLTLFSDMVETSPGSALVRANLGMALQGAARHQEAMAEYRLALELEPGFAIAHNNLAAALEEDGRLPEALQHYFEALRLAPGQFEAQVNAGHLMVRLGHLPAGMRLLEAAVARQPRSPAALFALAHASSLNARPQRAIELLERARRADPSMARVHYLLGKLHFEAGRHEDAARSMGQFLRLWPGQDDEHARAARRILDTPASAL